MWKSIPTSFFLRAASLIRTTFFSTKWTGIGSDFTRLKCWIGITFDTFHTCRFAQPDHRSSHGRLNFCEFAPARLVLSMALYSEVWFGFCTKPLNIGIGHIPKQEYAIFDRILCRYKDEPETATHCNMQFDLTMCIHPINESHPVSKMNINRKLRSESFGVIRKVQKLRAMKTCMGYLACLQLI